MRYFLFAYTSNPHGALGDLYKSGDDEDALRELANTLTERYLWVEYLDAQYMVIWRLQGDQWVSRELNK